MDLNKVKLLELFQSIYPPFKENHLSIILSNYNLSINNYHLCLQNKESSIVLYIYNLLEDLPVYNNLVDVIKEFFSLEYLKWCNSIKPVIYKYYKDNLIHLLNCVSIDTFYFKKDALIFLKNNLKYTVYTSLDNSLLLNLNIVISYNNNVLLNIKEDIQLNAHFSYNKFEEIKNINKVKFLFTTLINDYIMIENTFLYFKRLHLLNGDFNYYNICVNYPVKQITFENYMNLKSGYNNQVVDISKLGINIVIFNKIGSPNLVIKFKILYSLLNDLIYVDMYAESCKLERTKFNTLKKIDLTHWVNMSYDLWELNNRIYNELDILREEYNC